MAHLQFIILTIAERKIHTDEKLIKTSNVGSLNCDYCGNLLYMYTYIHKTTVISIGINK